MPCSEFDVFCINIKRKLTNLDYKYVVLDCSSLLHYTQYAIINFFIGGLTVAISLLLEVRRLIILVVSGYLDYHAIQMMNIIILYFDHSTYTQKYCSEPAKTQHLYFMTALPFLNPWPYRPRRSLLSLEVLSHIV